MKRFSQITLLGRGTKMNCCTRLKKEQQPCRQNYYCFPLSLCPISQLLQQDSFLSLLPHGYYYTYHTTTLESILLQQKNYSYVNTLTSLLLLQQQQLLLFCNFFYNHSRIIATTPTSLFLCSHYYFCVTVPKLYYNYMGSLFLIRVRSHCTRLKPLTVCKYTTVNCSISSYLFSHS